MILGKEQKRYRMPYPQPETVLDASTRYLVQSLQHPLKIEMLPHFTDEDTEAHIFYVTLPGHRGSRHRTETQSQVWKAMTFVTIPVHPAILEHHCFSELVHRFRSCSLHLGLERPVL